MATPGDAFPERSHARRVLVTGAGGYIGRRLCERLVASGADVHATVRSTKPDAPAHCWKVELSDFGATSRLLSNVRPDIVIHLAGHVAGAPDLALVRPTLESNVVATVNLLVAARESSVSRFVTTGSMVEPADPALAGSPYALSKWISTAYAQMFTTLYDLPTICMRVFMVYGPGQRDSRKLIPHVIESFLRDEPPRVASGAWEVDWVFIDDVVDAYIAALDAPAAAGETIDIGSGELVTIRGVIELLRELTGSSAEPQFGALQDRPFELPQRADVATADRLLSWRPRVPLDEGLERTVEWHRARLALAR